MADLRVGIDGNDVAVDPQPRDGTAWHAVLDEIGACVVDGDIAGEGAKRVHRDSTICDYHNRSLTSRPADVDQRCYEALRCVARGIAHRRPIRADCRSTLPFGQEWSTGEVPAFAYQELLEYSGEWPAGEERLWEPHSAVRRRVGGVLDRYDDDRTVVVVCQSGMIEAMTGVANTPPCGVVPYLHA